jgi:hypothetical protein
MADEKKIIIDEDWKDQAKREKEELAAAEKIEEAEKAVEESKETPERGPLPVADMTGLISMLGTQAFFAMGAFGAEEGVEPKVDLEMAKYSIDMLGVIEEKTKGNLSEQEAAALEGTLHQLRMTYVNVSKA